MKNERIKLKTLKESMEFNDKYQGVASIQFAGAVKDINTNKEKYDKRMKELMDKYKPDDRFAHTNVKGTEAQKKMHLSESNFKIIGKKKSLKESVNQNDLAKFIEKAVKDLQNGGIGTHFFELGNGLYYVIGFDQAENHDIQDYDAVDNTGKYAIVGKIAVNVDDIQSDYDFDWYMPYDKETGDVWDTETVLAKDEDGEFRAKEVIHEFNKMKDIEISEKGEILSESKKVKSIKKALKESLSNSKYKDLIGKHFDYSMDFDFLDIVADTMERRDSYIADGQSEEEALDNALDDIIYNIDVEKVINYYFSDDILDTYQGSALSELKGDIESILSESGNIKESLKESKEDDIWSYSCSGKIEKIKDYFDNGGKVNVRHKAFGGETSNVMGALRNHKYDAAKLLQSYGETILDDELEEYNGFKYRSMPYSPLTENLKESKSLKESYGHDVIYDLEDRAKSWMRDGYNLEDAIERAIDDGLIYSEDIIALGSHYGVIDDGELIGKFYDDLYNDMTKDLADYADELEDEDDSDEEIDESLKESTIDYVFDILVDGDPIDLYDYNELGHINTIEEARIIRDKVKADYPNSKIEISKHSWDEENHYTDELVEDTVKQGNSWVNKGKEGTHGKFRTKKEADAQRKAMFANTNPKTRDFGESIKEDWYHIEYKSGANPYIAKSEKELNRLKRKYGDKITEIKDKFYIVDDVEDLKEASSGKNFRKSWSDDGTVYSQTYYITSDEYGKVMTELEDKKEEIFGGDNIYGTYDALKERLAVKNNEIYPGLTAAKFIQEVLDLPNFKLDRNVRFIIDDKKGAIKEDTNINIGTVNVKAKVKVKNKEINGEEIDNKKEIKVKDKVQEGYNLCEGDVDKERCKDILNNWIDWTDVDESGDVGFAIDQLRSLHSEGEITDDEYDYITVNWDDLLESCQNNANKKSVEEDYAVVNKKTKRVVKPMTFEKKDDAVEMKKSLVSLMGISENDLDIVDVNTEEENLEKSQTYPVESPFDKKGGKSGLHKEQKFPIESPFESKDKKAAKDMKEGLNEDVKIILSNGIDNFIPWGEEAEDTWEKIKGADKVQSLAFMLEDMYPEGITETQLNDFLGKESKWIMDMLNMSGKKLVQDSMSVDDASLNRTVESGAAPIGEQKEKAQNELLKNEIDLSTDSSFAVDDKF